MQEVTSDVLDVLGSFKLSVIALHAHLGTYIPADIEGYGEFDSVQFNSRSKLFSDLVA